jgi:branched-chain amino acid transport system permease protein
VSSTFASVVAAVVGGCYLMWVRYVNPESALGVPVMLDVLLMVIIGGIGTLWGSLIGAAVLLTARLLLPDLRGLAVLLGGSELAQRLTARWLLVFGVFFILVVFFFPKGVLGTTREALRRRRVSGAPEV